MGSNVCDREERWSTGELERVGGCGEVGSKAAKVADRLGALKPPRRRGCTPSRSLTGVIAGVFPAAC